MNKLLGLIHSIDAFRAVTMFLMIFVNDIKIYICDGLDNRIIRKNQYLVKDLASQNGHLLPF
jgi:hypothetical protein